MSLEDLVDNIEADMLQSQLQQEVSQTLPYAVLQVLGVIHNKTSEWGDPDGNDPDSKFCTTLLNNEEFEYVSKTLQSILNLLGWEPVITGEDAAGKIVSLVPVGTVDLNNEGNE